MKVGFGDTAAAVPSRIRAAMKLLIGTWYENRESVNVGNIVTTDADGRRGVARELSPSGDGDGLMRAGQLRHRVRCSAALADDLAGGDDVSFTTSRRCGRTSRRSAAANFGKRRSSCPSSRTRSRSDIAADVAPACASFRNRVLRIHAAPDPDERRVRLLCMCTELVQ
jgi:hypothetical protein